METNLFAWIPTFQRTASSIHLESGQKFWSHSLFLSFMLIYKVLLVTFPFSLTSFSTQREFEDVKDQLKCKVVDIPENFISDGCSTVVLY